MNIITDLEESNKLMRLYQGSTVQVFMYTASLKRIALKLSLPNVNEIIYLVGVGCESMAGNFTFSNADLSITTSIDENFNEMITKITDKSGFELITSGGFSLAYGLEADFGTSFENFLMNKN